MATSPKKPRQTKATPISAWKTSVPPTELPSGKWAVLRRPGMQRFLSAGYLPDTLRAELQRQISSASRKNVPITDLTESMTVEDVEEIMAAMDRVATEVFVDPPLRWHMRPVMAVAEGQEPAPLTNSKGKPVYEEIPPEDRQGDVLYTDEVEVEDKQFAFQYGVGGSADLTRFRAAAASLVDGVSAGQALEVSTERDPVSEG